MLANLRIEASDGNVFPVNTPIEVTLEMNADKVLAVHATCQGKECTVESENPFANTYQTDDEKKIMLAERETYVAADKNGGIPTKDSLVKLRNAYSNAENEYREAEVLEMQLKYYPQDNMYNRLGVLYHNSGNISKAIYNFRKAIAADEENPWPHSNLGHDLYRIGKYREAKKELERAIELKADLPAALIILGEIYNEEEDKDTANELFEQAYNILMRYFHQGQMEDYEYSWLQSVAHSLVRELPDEVKAPRNNRKNSLGFNADNLVSITKKMEVEV